MKNKKIRGIALNSIICAAYVTLCYTLNAVSFGPLQFRVATLLLPFGILDKRLAKGLVLGVIVANLSSSLGIIDIITGACIQILQFYVFAKVVKNIYLQYYLCFIKRNFCRARTIICFKCSLFIFFFKCWYKRYGTVFDRNSFM